jgi:hypothetical protein
MVCEWFGIKTTQTIFSGLASKSVAAVVSILVSKLVARVSWFGPQNRQLRFGNWASKSLQRFLGLGLKTMQASGCQLQHKTNGGRTVQDTHQDLTACFT